MLKNLNFKTNIINQDGEKDKEGKAEKPRKSKKHVEEKDEDGQWMVEFLFI